VVEDTTDANECRQVVGKEEPAFFGRWCTAVLAVAFRTCRTGSVRTFESHVETVFRECVNGREILRDNWNGVKLETVADFVLLGRQDNECVLPVQDFSCCSEWRHKVSRVPSFLGQDHDAHLPHTLLCWREGC
jgi:hypothetical protein